MSILGSYCHTAASGDDDSGFTADSGQLRRFQSSKFLLAELIENLTDGLSGRRLYFRIQIDKSVVETAGERPADRSLAGPHEAYKKDISH
jgi:hypothetical protein